jgi:hypothetical protein
VADVDAPETAVDGLLDIMMPGKTDCFNLQYPLYQYYICFSCYCGFSGHTGFCS